MNEKELLAQMAEVIAQNSTLMKSIVDQNIEKAAAGFQTANQLHGFDGLWSTTTEQEVITARVKPEGIASAIPIFSSVTENPIFGLLTGYTAVTGSEPVNPCDDAPTGFVKGGTLTARFGLARRDTNTIDIGNVMRRVNRGDFTDLRLVGSVLGSTNLPPSGLNEKQILSVLTMNEMVTVGVNMERLLLTQMWQGAFGTGTQFAGLDSQIATGQVDSSTGVAMSAADSDIKDFNFDNVEGGGRSIVEYMSMVEFFLYNNARRMGLLPVQWIISMRPELWQVLTEVWPCQYNTGQCATSVVGSSSRVFIDGRENIAQRDSIRDKMELNINGRIYPVVVDDGINEATNVTEGNLEAAQYASSIYFVPLTVVGNLPVTYREYLDYRAPLVGQNTALLHGTENFWTDDGIYGWATEKNKWCYKLAARTEQRIVLRTPQLAGKIQNVMYAPLQHLRSDDTSSDYFRDGGVSLRNTNDSFSAAWA